LENLSQQVPEDIITWLLRETQRLYRDVLNLVRETYGELNFHDALIALGCRELGVGFIASFDRDFDRITWLTRVAEPEAVATSIGAFSAPLK